MSSILAGQACDVPDWSTQKTLTSAIMATLGSGFVPLMSVDIGRNLKLSSGGTLWRGIFGFAQDKLTLAANR